MIKNNDRNSISTKFSLKKTSTIISKMKKPKFKINMKKQKKCKNLLKNVNLKTLKN